MHEFCGSVVSNRGSQPTSLLVPIHPRRNNQRLAKFVSSMPLRSPGASRKEITLIWNSKGPPLLRASQQLASQSAGREMASHHGVAGPSLRTSGRRPLQAAQHSRRVKQRVGSADQQTRQMSTGVLLSTHRSVRIWDMQSTKQLGTCDTWSVRRGV